jgi:predicted secreted protein
MAAGRGLLGREITLTVGGATILGVVTKDFSFTNSAVDVTDDQSSGYRELLATGGLKQLDMSLAGKVKNYALLRTLFETSQMMACVVQLGDGASTDSTLTFDALLTDLQFGGDSNDGVEFSANLQSSGTVAFVAGT